MFFVCDWGMVLAVEKGPTLPCNIKISKKKAELPIELAPTLALSLATCILNLYGRRITCLFFLTHDYSPFRPLN